ncbi:hypothetical protein FRC04_003834 [Tulasnella sp. 424]|nr:hypothetical protein FRC04_003834 [Tulasnella sp. 424]
MKRLQAAMTRLVTKTKSASPGPDASATIVAVLKVASTISVPGVQIACTAIIEFITMMEGTANANDRNWKALLSIIDSCARRVTEFAESISTGQSSEYIVNSTDKRATIAREAIVEFEKTISSTKEKVEVRLKNGKIRKTHWAQPPFKGRILNILCLPSTEISIVSKAKSDEFDIPGARPVHNEDIEITGEIDFVARIPETFWQNLVEVDLGNNKVRVAKIYSPAKSSKQKFLDDMKWFSEKIKIARLYGYNANSQIPFIVFTFSSVKPLRQHLVQLSRTDPQKYILTGWQLDMHKAGTYLCSVAVDLRKEYPTIERSIVDAATGQSGQLVVAPAEMRTATEFNDQADPSALAIRRFWSHFLIDKYDERWERYLRPFILALLESPEIFFQYPLHELTSPLEASEAIYKLWPPATERPLKVWQNSFPPDVIAGDVGILKLDPKKKFKILRGPKDVEFRRLANIADLAGGIQFCPPPKGDPTSSPNIYRATFQSTADTYLPTTDLGVLWGYHFSKSKIPLPVLAKLFKDLGEQHGVPPTDIVLVSTLEYEFDAEGPLPMRKALQKGQKIYLYMSFSPENQHRFESGQWSFHESLPTESEAAAEASKLSALNCPKIRKGRPWGEVAYLQFEEEDFNFYLNNSENEGGMDQVATIEELNE